MKHIAIVGEERSGAPLRFSWQEPVMRSLSWLAWARGVSIPLLHIVDATARSIKAQGLRSPGLMATRFTMEESFYMDR